MLAPPTLAPTEYCAPSQVRMYAKPGDYKKATQSIWFGGANASAVTLPVSEQ